MGVAYTKTATSLSMVIDFKPVVIPSSHPNYEQLVKLVRNPDTSERDLKPFIDIPKALETFTGGNITVANGRLFYKGFEVKSELAKTIIELTRQGKSEAAKPFEMFMEKAFDNPDPRAAMDLFEWVAASNLPLTPEGDILAWKAVRSDYQSIRAGKRGHLDHSIGSVVEEPREETDSDPNRTCSSGIHFCSIDYLSSGYAGGGSRIVAVAISPTDVVAFPKDYGNSKGRCCRLRVVGEVPLKDVPNFYPQGKKIYDGWDAKRDVAPASKSRVHVGEVWADSDNDEWTIRSIDGHAGTFRASLTRMNDRRIGSPSTKGTSFDEDTMTTDRGNYTLVRRVRA